MINFDKALGIYPQALQVYSRRANLIASNLANADTPNYKARDIDFKQVLSNLKANKSDFINVSFNDMNSDTPPSQLGELLYRNPTAPSLDGNTVDVQMEVAAFGENAMRYKATLQFLSGKFKGISKALRGE